MIYRIAEITDWLRAQRDGVFVSADLAAEGYIHCSAREQVTRTAQKYYTGRTDLVLLEIDDAVLGAALVREDLTGSGLFPHVYGSIPLSAIRGHVEFSAAAAKDEKSIAGLFAKLEKSRS